MEKEYRTIEGDVIQEPYREFLELCLLSVKDNEMNKKDYEIFETVHGFILCITIKQMARCQPGGELVTVGYNSPRISPNSMKSILETGKVRYIEGGSWQTGQCINIAFENWAGGAKYWNKED